jgi:hypothetical protein
MSTIDDRMLLSSGAMSMGRRDRRGHHVSLNGEGRDV